MRKKRNGQSTELLERFARFEREVQRKRQEYNRAQGSVAQLQKQAMAELELNSVKACKQAIERLQKQVDRQESELQRQLQIFENRWREYLNG